MLLAFWRLSETDVARKDVWGGLALGFLFPSSPPAVLRGGGRWARSLLYQSKNKATQREGEAEEDLTVLSWQEPAPKK